MRQCAPLQQTLLFLFPSSPFSSFSPPSLVSIPNPHRISASTDDGVEGGSLSLTAKERRRLRNERRESKAGYGWREKVEEQLIKKPKKQYVSWTEELNLDNLALLGPQWWVVRVSRVSGQWTAELIAKLLARKFPEMDFKALLLLFVSLQILSICVGGWVGEFPILNPRYLSYVWNEEAAWSASGLLATACVSIHITITIATKAAFQVYVPSVHEKRKLKNGTLSVKPKPLFPGSIFLWCVLNKEIHDFDPELETRKKHAFFTHFAATSKFLNCDQFVPFSKRQINRAKPISAEDMEEIFRQAKEEQERLDHAFEVARKAEGIHSIEELTVNAVSDSQAVKKSTTDAKPKRWSKKGLDASESSTENGDGYKFLAPGSSVRVTSGPFQEFEGCVKELNRKSQKMLHNFFLENLQVKAYCKGNTMMDLPESLSIGQCEMGVNCQVLVSALSSPHGQPLALHHFYAACLLFATVGFMLFGKENIVELDFEQILPEST
ncbi:hypothetical protein ACLOJK_012521 [Asimina triloba]